MRTIVAIASAVSAFVVCTAPAQAQNYPNKRVRIVVPWPPAGIPDVITRAIEQRLTEVPWQILPLRRVAARARVAAGWLRWRLRMAHRSS